MPVRAFRINRSRQEVHHMQREGMRISLIASIAALSLAFALPIARAETRVEADANAASALAEFREAAKLSPDRMRGAELFRVCAACHGAEGRGTSDGSIPAIAGQHGS